jgi:hypothetical protein
LAFFLFLPAAATAADPAVAPTSWDAQPREGWVDGCWMWDQQSGDLVWCPGCLNLPVCGDVCWEGEGNQAAYNCPGFDFINLSFGWGNSVHGSYAPAERLIVRDSLGLGVHIAAAAPHGHSAGAKFMHTLA